MPDKTTEQDSFTQAYIECALWASNDESDPETGGEPLDKNYDPTDIAPEALVTIIEDCRAFQEANMELLAQWYDICGETLERAGHDFWLTRNGHGAGFWDRWASGTPQGKIGDRLAEIAHVYRSCDLYVGDDGLIYCQ